VLAGSEVTLHENCVRAFELSEKGRAMLLAASRTRAALCNSCGQPIATHPGGKACPNVLGAMGGRR
jgi:hypothetical protein